VLVVPLSVLLIQELSLSNGGKGGHRFFSLLEAVLEDSLKLVILNCEFTI
jgi:hypothetical protein